MIRKKKVLSVITCFMMIGLIASLISGCAGDGGNGGNGGGGDEPQYGGVLTIPTNADPTGWDDALANAHYTTAGCYQTLWSGDWTKGNAGGYGTKECDWFIPGAINRIDLDTGKIAESWEIGDDYIIFHLRQGVEWEDRSPTKGRLVTADDVVFSLQRHQASGSYFQKAYPSTAAAMSISKVDESTVRIDCTPIEMSTLISMIDFMYIFPKDVIETYGNMNDWERAIGTGPFWVQNYQPGVQVYLERRDNYWETNPIGPGQGDQLPYLDGVRILIQPDPSTVDSLFTTGQLDIHLAVEYDRAQSIKASCPDAKYVTYFTDGGKAVICFKLTNPDKPQYQDLRVRQALMLAIDHQKMVEELYSGSGKYLYWPLADCKEYADAYLELDEYPDTPDERVGEYGLSVNDLYTYNPTKAKELLADAGYPDGFQCQIIVWNYYYYLDQLEVVKDMWADIGVDMTIKTVDYATVTTTMYFHSFDDLLYSGYAGAGTYFKGTNWAGSGMFNGSLINDPILNDYKAQMLAAYPDEDEAMSIHREMLPYLQEQCYVIQVVGGDTYRFWWPWVKNYSGEGALGYYKYINSGFGGFTQYLWIDQELKESMGF